MFNQVSVTNPLQLESTNFSFMLVTPVNLQLGMTSKVTSATARLEQPTANGTEQIHISEKVKLQHQIVPRVCNQNQSSDFSPNAILLQFLKLCC